MSAATSTIPNFGRKWRITINTGSDENGNSQKIVVDSVAWKPEPLRITFECFQSVLDSWWYADIVLYNLSNQILNTVITQGMNVQLEAGYQTGPFGTIFEGLVYQPIWERMDIVDYKLTLKCLVGLDTEQNNFASNAFNAGMDTRQWMALMASNAITPINILPQDPASIAALSAVKQSRGGVVHGPPAKYFEQAAKTNGLNHWYEQQGAQIRSLRNPDAKPPTIKFGVGSGLIGTPQQTQFGMNCRVLLDPRLTPLTAIELDQSLSIRPNPFVPKPDGSGVLPTIINQSGIYTIGGVRFIGDSRSNEWYSELTTFAGNQLIEALEAYGDFNGRS